MTRCDRIHLVQDFLDGELTAADVATFRAHLAGCADCASEVARFRRVFLELDNVPVVEPPPGLEERILGRVLPSRVRRRRLIALGWGYAAALAVCVGGISLWLARPGNQEVLGSLTARVVRGALGAGLFGLNLLGSSTVGLAEGWNRLLQFGQHLAPLSRALATVVGQTQVAVALGAAIAACAALLWWMRPRPAARKVRHVGLRVF